jgi:replicative DNA helicase
MKGTHSFLADGIVAHNSLEQDSDMVLFLHKQAEDATVLDAILAKNRMGPKGRTKLAWRPKQAMFTDL